jgi:hypothetical protein
VATILVLLRGNVTQSSAGKGLKTGYVTLVYYYGN